MNRQSDAPRLACHVTNVPNGAVDSCFDLGVREIGEVFAELAVQITMAPIEIWLTDTMDMQLFLINELTKFSKVRVSFVRRNRVGLRDVQPIHVCRVDAAHLRFICRLTGVTPPAIIITLGGIAEQSLEAVRTLAMAATT